MAHREKSHWHLAERINVEWGSSTIGQQRQLREICTHVANIITLEVIDACTKVEEVSYQVLYRVFDTNNKTNYISYD